MKVTAELNYLRMSPRKVRLVADAIRGKRVPEAERTLKFLARGAAAPLEKLLHSAVASAKHNFQVSGEGALVVAEIRVDEGPTLKRSRPRAFGRAFPVRKRTSHVKLVLETAEAPKKVKRPKKPLAAVVRGAEEAGTVAAKPQRERGVFRVKPKVATKSTDFVRRMFRRKAI